VTAPANEILQALAGAIALARLHDTASPATGFEQRYVYLIARFVTALEEPVRCGQAGDAAADYDYTLHLTPV